MHETCSLLGPLPRADFDPDADKLLDPFVECLAGANNALRQNAVTHTLTMAIPPVRKRIIDRLMALLKSRSKQIRGAAAESLFEMGEVALPGLRYAILSAQDGTLKVRLAEILGRIGATCSPARQWEIQVAFEVTMAKTKTPKVIAAVLKAMDQICPGSAEIEIALRQMMAGRGGV